MLLLLFIIVQIKNEECVAMEMDDLYMLRSFNDLDDPINNIEYRQSKLT